jgi:hypothetical protein
MGKKKTTKSSADQAAVTAPADAAKADGAKTTKKAGKAKKEAKPKKASRLDATARVLAETG